MKLHSQLEPLRQRYVHFSRQKNESGHVYGMSLSDSSTVLGNKRFNVDMDDSVCR